MSTARLEVVGEERGEGCPAEDIARWRETGDVLLCETRRIAAVRTSIQPLCVPCSDPGHIPPLSTSRGISASCKCFSISSAVSVF